MLTVSIKFSVNWLIIAGKTTLHSRLLTSIKVERLINAHVYTDYDCCLSLIELKRRLPLVHSEVRAEDSSKLRSLELSNPVSRREEPLSYIAFPENFSVSFASSVDCFVVTRLRNSLGLDLL